MWGSLVTVAGGIGFAAWMAYMVRRDRLALAGDPIAARLSRLPDRCWMVTTNHSWLPWRPLEFVVHEFTFTMRETGVRDGCVYMQQRTETREVTRIRWRSLEELESKVNLLS